MVSCTSGDMASFGLSALHATMSQIMVLMRSPCVCPSTFKQSAGSSKGCKTPARRASSKS